MMSSHGWQLHHDGVSWARSRTRSSVAAGTGSGRNLRALKRERRAVSSSIEGRGTRPGRGRMENWATSAPAERICPAESARSVPLNGNQTSCASSARLVKLWLEPLVHLDLQTRGEPVAGVGQGHDLHQFGQHLVVHALL